MTPAYPPTRRTSFSEQIHGRTLPDPFHWLEGAEEAAEIAAWMAAQQALTDRIIGTDPRERRIRDYLTAFLAKPFVFHTFDAGRYRFQLEERPDTQQPVLLRRDSVNTIVAVDPDAAPLDGVPAILDQESISASPDGRHIAYSLKTAEDVGMSLFVRDLETGAVTEGFPLNILPRVSWHPRGRGFFYNQCQGEFIESERRAGRPDGIYWHGLGTPPAQDKLIFAMTWPAAHGAIPNVSDDGRFLFVNQIMLVADSCQLDAIPLDAECNAIGHAIALVRECGVSYIGTAERRHYFATDLDAPNGRVVAFDPTAAPRPITVVPERAEPLDFSSRAARTERAVIADHRLYLTYLNGSGHALRAFTLAGEALRDVPLPAGTAIAGAGGDRYGKLSVASDGQLILDLWRRAAPPFSAFYDPKTQGLVAPPDDATTDIVTEEVRYRSKDGTEVPLTILARGGIPRDGSRPCLLYGYGGWGMPIIPEFQLDIAGWLALGGVYAVANIRGGGEFGARWHDAGKGANKQNVFDDFIAAAEYLIAERIAKPGQLAIRGLSNGGLLTGACLTQRPEFFGAVISELPLLDPLRMGRDHWSAQIAPELGNPTDDPGAFDTIARYSPLQNLHEDVAYPPTLVVAADKDAQLLMDGARKFVATLQALEPAGGPYLLHIVRGAAHGGWSKSQQIETASRELAFFAQIFGMTLAAERIGA
ncbi:MAG TPA: prolyl oligopeptidase family serine peptidase [Rhizomicrobium sp.]|jgi:prolyl oligopeptidase